MKNVLLVLLCLHSLKNLFAPISFQHKAQKTEAKRRFYYKCLLNYKAYGFNATSFELAS